MNTRVEVIAENIWLLRYPLKVIGTHIGRNVTVIRLSTRELLIHSTANFTREDIRAIEELGEPAWLIDATLLHDTFAQAGHVAFPHLPYLAPDGFQKLTGVDTYSLELQLPPTWIKEIRVFEIEGIPRAREYAFLHRPSRTLIVADLIFNLQPSPRYWENFVRRKIMGVKQFPGTSRLFCWCVKDRKKFLRSIETLISQDFDRIIVGHGDVIERGGKAILKEALSAVHLYPDGFS